MTYQKVFRSQYQAALEMLKQTVSQCPELIWDSPDDKTKFWRIAYHALFFTHLYLQETEHDFTAWSGHRDEYEFLGPIPWENNRLPKTGDPFTREEILAYLAVCGQQIDEKTQQFDPEAGSGFSWLPMSKLELHIYNIRHLQQHTAELMERLGTRTEIRLNWVVKSEA